MEELTNKYLAAAIIVKGKYIVLRSAFNEDFRKHGYYFPGCKKSSKISDAKQLTEQIYLKYKLKIVVDDLIGDVVVNVDKHKQAYLYLYKCLLKSDTSLDSDGVIVKSFTPEQLKTLYFDVADQYLVDRIEHFHRVYENEKKISSLSKQAQQKCLLFYNCLIYYNKQVAKQDMIDFAALLHTNASFEEIKNAFLWIMERSHLSFEKFIIRMKGKEEK